MLTNRHQTPKARRRRRHKPTRIPKALRRPRLRLSMGTARRIAEVMPGGLISGLINDAGRGSSLENILSGWEGRDPAGTETALGGLAHRWAEEDGKGREAAAE